tara:strand:+ start:126 stop:569 length:444 start_codon:yes stop_codon:yes gene_type:complete
MAIRTRADLLAQTIERAGHTIFNPRTIEADDILDSTLIVGPIQSAAATDAAHYSIDGTRGEIRSQLQSGIAADTGFTLELRNTSIQADSVIMCNLVKPSDIVTGGGLVSGSVVTANVVAASTASLNFFNTGAALANDAPFTASFAII